MTYKSPTKPMKQQVAALKAIDNKPTNPCPEDVFGLLMEMGTGKTKVILDEFGEMATSGGPTDLLVLAPAGCYKNWYEDKSDDQPSELNRHCDPEFRERLIDVGWVSGGGAGNKRAIEAMLKSRDPKRPRALFMNVEALSTVEKARTLCREFLSQRHATMVIDESTMIKGKSKRAKAVIDIGKDADVRRIMTGLITPKSPMDLYYQMEFLDPRVLGFKSWYGFRARHAVLKKMHLHGRKAFDVIVGFQNLDELQQKIGLYSYRALKKDCLDLADKVYMSRDVEHTPEQKKMYQELRLFANAAIGDSFVTSTNVISLMMRLHQINAGYVTDEEGRKHEVPENRTKALMEVLGEHSGKAIIWTNFTDPIEKIKKTLEKEFGEGCCALFWGGNKKERGDEERRFLGDPRCRFMVATQGAGMRGNTWVNATLTVYYSNDYDLEKRAQSEDRNHRKGQNDKVTYVDLIVRGTVDEKIVKSLRNKIDMATVITGENYREWLI